MSTFSCGHKSGRLDKQNKASSQNQSISSKRTDTPQNYKGKNVVKMIDEHGVKYIKVEINGIRLKFVFDTGASSISISSAEATVLYKQGTLRDEDILDVQLFQDATGNISVGTLINLRTVKIGNKTLDNVQAVVVDNDHAPLLLGQTALEKFGKISIDNKRNEITFE